MNADSVLFRRQQPGKRRGTERPKNRKADDNRKKADTEARSVGGYTESIFSEGREQRGLGVFLFFVSSFFQTVYSVLTPYLRPSVSAFVVRKMRLGLNLGPRKVPSDFLRKIH